MRSVPLLLIGPVCSGKTTVLPLVAERLGMPAVDLDDVAEPYYREADRGWDAYQRVGAERGFRASYDWWQDGHVHAVRKALMDYPDSVIALGAGHTDYDRTELFDQVVGIVSDRFVALILPWRDLDRSVNTCRERSIADRGRDWRPEGVDMIDRWVRSGQNRRLATVTVFVEGRPPDSVADEIVLLYRAWQLE